MDPQSVIQICLQWPDAVLVYPFEEPHAVVKHRANGKWFALITRRKGQDIVNLKCPPEEAILLRQIYTGIVPAWHMNKTHWNTVFLQSDVPPDVLRRLIEMSYMLTKPKQKQKQQKSVSK